MQARTHPDLHVIFRQLNREHPDPVVRKRKALIISVDVVREFIVKRIALKPTRGRIKVFLVREADRMNEQAQNALLKTLEEPPGSALLVLLVDSIDRMLPTTLSRCQVVRFDALPVAFVQEKLSKLVPDLDSDRVAWYAQSSDGSLGSALERIEEATPRASNSSIRQRYSPRDHVQPTVQRVNVGHRPAVEYRTVFANVCASVGTYFPVGQLWKWRSILQGAWSL